MHAMNCRCAFLHISDPKQHCKLFDSLVLPLLSYASEVWVVDEEVGKSAEQLHRQFLNHILGVRGNTATLIVLAEFGRYPLRFHWWQQILRYHNCIDYLSDDERLIQCASDQLHGQSVFIKFCRSYSTAAHQATASAGFAPALLGSEQLVQGWLLIVQEFVDAVSWDEVVDKPVESLKAAVRALHAAGFVHGDLRGCSRLVAASVVSLIDFEWAGLAGQQHTRTS